MSQVQSIPRGKTQVEGFLPPSSLALFTDFSETGVQISLGDVQLRC